MVFKIGSKTYRDPPRRHQRYNLSVIVGDALIAGEIVIVEGTEADAKRLQTLGEQHAEQSGLPCVGYVTWDNMD